MSRRSHPYFGKLNRLEQARTAASAGDGHGRAPPMSPDEQQGMLWEALRGAEGAA